MIAMLAETQYSASDHYLGLAIVGGLLLLLLGWIRGGRGVMIAVLGGAAALALGVYRGKQLGELPWQNPPETIVGLIIMGMVAGLCLELTLQPMASRSSAPDLERIRERVR